jgi:mannose PTS system EIIA component
MFDLLLLSHGNFSVELLKTAEMIVGSQGPGIKAIAVLPERGMDELSQDIRKFVEDSSPQGGTLILCDIFSGSPFLASTSVFGALDGNVPIEIVTGANLPMLIEVLNCRESCDLKKAKDIAVSEGIAGIQDFAAKLKSGT